MEFLYKINAQSRKLKSEFYVNAIVAELRKEGDFPEVRPDERSDFELNLPVQLSRFLTECNNILLYDDSEIIDFTKIKVDYLMTLIYTCLCKEDVLLESESIPIQAVILFLTLNSGKYVDTLDVDEIVISSVFDKAVEVYGQRIALHAPISLSLMRIWSFFLTTNIVDLDTKKLIDVLCLYLVNNTVSVISSFNVDDIHNAGINIVFYCFKTMIDNENARNKRNIVTMISLKLIENCTNEILNENIVSFFKIFLHRFSHELWYFPLLLVILKRMKNNKLFIKIINQLPIEKHEVIINIIINNYVQATDEKEILAYLTILNCMIEVPYQSFPDLRRQRLVRRIVMEVYYRCIENSHNIKIQVMELFIKWSQMKDINVRRYMKLMFQNGNKMQARKLFDALFRGVDITWKVTPYNITFIIFTCRMFMLNKVLMTQSRMKILEVLCVKCTANCLKPCLPVILELIRYYARIQHPMLKPLLIIIISNALNATISDGYYMKELFGLMSNAMVATSDSEVEFGVCSVVLSNDLKCFDLFKTLQERNLIRTEHINVLLREKILKYPCSWKLLTVLMDNNDDYINFPSFIEHYFERVKTQAFFLASESQYVIQVLTKIYMRKLEQNLITNSDVRFAHTIDTTLSEHVRNLSIPAREVGDSLILLITLNKITHSGLNWIQGFFHENLSIVLENINFVKIPYIRQLMYVERILILFDIDVDHHIVDELIEIMGGRGDSMIIHNELYAGLVTLLAKVCFKYQDRINYAVPLFQQAMLHGNAHVQIMSISSLYDISNLHLHEFDALYPNLLTLLKSSTMNVKVIAAKMVIRLVNDDYVRLTCEEFLVLMLILLHRNYKLCIHFVELFESDFVYRNQRTIQKYFIHLMFFLNKYKTNRKYSIMLESIAGDWDFSYERRIVIYKLLFCSMDRMKQLQLLNILNDDFLMPFYHGTIRLAPNMLNIVRDILMLICFHTSQYMNSRDVGNIEDLYTTLFANMKKDFFSRKRFADSHEMAFDRILEKLITSVLLLLYKLEKPNVSMLPQFFGAIGFVTQAFYNKIIHLVHSNRKLKNLYYELPNCYEKYKEMIATEQIDVLSYCDKKEWILYLGNVEDEEEETL